MEPRGLARGWPTATTQLAQGPGCMGPIGDAYHASFAHIIPSDLKPRHNFLVIFLRGGAAAFSNFFSKG